MKRTYTISIKKTTCKYFILFMNISYLLSISQLSDIPVVAWIDSLLIVLGVVIIFIHYLSSRTTIGKNQLLIIIFSMVLGVVVFLISGGPTLLKFILFIFAIKDIDEKEVLNYFFISLIIGMVIVIFPALLGMTDLVYSGGKQAYTFGFGNPNNAPMVMVGIISTYNILHEEKITTKVICIESMIAIILYIMCRSRTATIVLFISEVLLIVNNCIKKKKIIQESMVIGQWLFLIFTGISYYMASAYDSGKAFWAEMDLLLSWRPYLWNKYFKDYTIGLFGTQLDFSNTGALDNAYLNLIYRYGIIVLLLYALIFIWMSKYATKNKRWILLIYVISYEIYFMFEFGPILINVNSVLLVFSSLFINYIGKRINTNK